VRAPARPPSPPRRCRGARERASAEAGGACLGVGGVHLRVRLDEERDQEDDGDEEAEDDGKERTELHIEANGPAVNRDDARHRGGHLLQRVELERHLRRRDRLRERELAAGAERRLRHEGLNRSSEAKDNEQLCARASTQPSQWTDSTAYRSFARERGGGAAGAGLPQTAPRRTRRERRRGPMHRGYLRPGGRSRVGAARGGANSSRLGGELTRHG